MSAARWLVVLAAASGFMAVAAAAFGAHWLRPRLEPDALAVFETAARYQMYHALATLLATLLFDRWQAPALALAGWLFLGGTVVFSGSLYLLVGTGARWWGAVTPIGGLALLAGWGLLLWGAMSGRAR
ncbi:MAG TPA: DUF423 domain-containing protein [Gemmatimonadales bacterium]|nr:DUF423 domain-containing protein [Gemmatimonadales bacterium]